MSGSERHARTPRSTTIPATSIHHGPKPPHTSSAWTYVSSVGIFYPRLLTLVVRVQKRLHLVAPTLRHALDGASAALHCVVVDLRHLLFTPDQVAELEKRRLLVG